MSWARTERGRLGGCEVDVCLCPRCEEWPEFVKDYDGDIWYRFRCPGCGFAPGLRSYETGSEALDAWNSGAEREAERLHREMVAEETNKESMA